MQYLKDLIGQSHLPARYDQLSVLVHMPAS